VAKVVKGGQEWSKWSSGVKSGQSGQMGSRVVKWGQEWSKWLSGSRVIKWGQEWSIEWSIERSRVSRVVSDCLKKILKFLGVVNI